MKTNLTILFSGNGVLQREAKIFFSRDDRRNGGAHQNN
jgi:hypothetical protein